MTDTYEERLAAQFGPLVVDKKLVRALVVEGLPDFAREYIFAEAQSRDGAVDVPAVRDRIRRFVPDAESRNTIVSTLMTTGRVRIIAHVQATPQLRVGEHVGRIDHLDGQAIHVPDEIVAGCRELVAGGAWGACLLAYDKDQGRRIVLDEFTPYQLTNPDLGAFRVARKHFTFDEWISMLVVATGLSPEAFPSRRARLIYLTRFAALTQSGLHMMELGPRGTSKTHSYKNISAKVHVASGARVSTAQFFYDLQAKRLGLVGRKVVMLDEFPDMTVSDAAFMGSLKDVMESAGFTRGGRQFSTDVSIVFAGNIDLDEEGAGPDRRYSTLLDVVPPAFRDTAFVDRLHGILPGWEIPKIRPESLASGPGLVRDYLGEVLLALRGDGVFLEHLRAHYPVGPSGEATLRDQNAVHKVASGLMKMLFPDGDIPEPDLAEVLRIAIELRQRVHNQLCLLAPGEFRPRALHIGALVGAADDLVERRRLEDHDIIVNLKDVVGKITILSVSPDGRGHVGFVECAQLDAGRGLQVTGIHGPELRHSVVASFNALLNLGDALGCTPDLIRKKRMSVHLLNIAQRREGPSAGLAIALAMLSAATGRPVRRELAVTGELSTHGHVTAIGGVAAKLRAAADRGRKIVIIPAENARDVAASKDVLDRLDVRFVRTLEEAAAVALLPDEVL